jgi:hypothetical protein
LILISAAKIALNQDQSLPVDDSAMQHMLHLESFVVDTYGSRDPDLTHIFVPTKRLRLHPNFKINLPGLSAGISPDSVPISELPTIIQEVNNAFQDALLNALNPAHRYYIAFDQLDLGFDNTSDEYKSRLIGLLLACRDLNLAAKARGVKLFVVVFLRDDIYEVLHFEDKNKMTENYMSLIEWDTRRARRTLKSLMEKRFSILLCDEQQPIIAWSDVFDETREMPGHQTKYDHIRDRTYLRPRDMIKFANSALERYKSRVQESFGDSDDPDKIDNIDVHNSRAEYSEYFLKEIDDEIHKHLPDYEQYLDMFRSVGKWQFDLSEFEKVFNSRSMSSASSAIAGLERLYDFSIIGFYRAGGRGFGGSEYMFSYRESRTGFDPTSPRFRIHPGLIEVLNLKRS